VRVAKLDDEVVRKGSAGLRHQPRVKLKLMVTVEEVPHQNDYPNHDYFAEDLNWWHRLMIEGPSLD
jgi:hypothetical protein